ncbi:probable GTP-binding protein EngB [Schistocerca gregaria]|uniref:probable GTP-binding protein EngB n=1 Tax=Schistocerca gregaria TaxID=7010 RepID=UPI00211EED9B|nr:probable GTP-binding protein EngB [Schistocerca gregaria]
MLHTPVLRGIKCAFAPRNFSNRIREGLHCPQKSASAKHLYGTRQRNVRPLAEVPESKQEIAGNSRSKDFKSMPVDPGILNFIDSAKLGKRRLPMHRGAAKGVKPLDLSRIVPTEVDQLFSHRTVKFLAAANSPGSFPQDGLPEICFIGRSNVGKSSLLNALCNAAVAKTSARPGFTQTLNWFVFCNSMHLVDLPGYGFAFANAEKVCNWIELVKLYLSSRSSLKKCMVLIDARQPFKQSDLDLLDFLERACRIPYQVVLTKADLVTPADLAKRWQLARAEMESRSRGSKTVHMVSSKNKAGISYLRKEVANLIRPEHKKEIAKRMRAKDEEIKEKEKILEQDKLKSRSVLFKKLKKIRKRLIVSPKPRKRVS